MDTNHFYILNYVWIVIGVITFTALVLTDIRAPYGRHINTNLGKMIDNRWGWFWMELMAFLIFPLLVIFGPRHKDLLTWVLVGLWTLHYFNRTFIFPFRLKTSGKKMPVVIVLSALFFNVINGILNGYYLGYLAPADGNLIVWNVILGLVLFFAGFLINQISDTKLIALRQLTKGYRVPKGWLFEYISCPNHFGELIEWIGFALIAYNLPALTFAIWTFCNLVPRAFNHHDWYHENFIDYPKKRKAIFPFIR